MVNWRRLEEYLSFPCFEQEPCYHHARVVESELIGVPDDDPVSEVSVSPQPNLRTDVRTQESCPHWAHSTRPGSSRLVRGAGGRGGAALAVTRSYPTHGTECKPWSTRSGEETS